MFIETKLYRSGKRYCFNTDNVTDFMEGETQEGSETTYVFFKNNSEEGMEIAMAFEEIKECVVDKKI